MITTDTRKRPLRKSGNCPRDRARLYRLYRYSPISEDKIDAQLSLARELRLQQVGMVDVAIRKKILLDPHTQNESWSRGVKFKIRELARRGADWRDFDVSSALHFDDIAEAFINADWDVPDPSEHPRNVLGTPNA